tara:strand:+ start:701 stop:1912 length:1212 start_codon:yes stop_codon:yes gene_type:complete
MEMIYNTIFKKNTILPFLSVFFFCGLLFSQSEETVTSSIDSIVKEDKSLRFYQRSGDYYPYSKLTEQDTLEWPLEYDLALDFIDLKGFDVKNEIFTSVLAFTSYSDFPFEWVQPSTGEPWDMTHSEYFQAVLRESELRLVGDAIKEEYINPADSIIFYGSKLSKEARNVDTEFDHKWDLGNYPFDTQKLLFEFKTYYDTSLVRLKPSKKFVSTFEKNMRNLKPGYTIIGIDHRSEYNEVSTERINTAPGVIRPTVLQSLIFELKVKRGGIVLFFKIFTGGLLSFFISCLVFLIPLKDLDSRINLAVGGIFGAIGSSAFVYDVLPVVNVFTKADAINNLIIAMVVFNILVLLLQQSTFKRINIDGKYLYRTVESPYFKSLQNSRFAFFYSIFAFFVILTAIFLW